MSANLMSLARSGGKFLKLFGDRKMVRPLPYDAEVEWIQNSSSCFINTGVAFKRIQKVSAKFTDAIYISPVMWGCGLFGVCEETNGNATGLKINSDGFVFRNSRGGNDVIVSGTPPFDIEFSANKTTRRLTANGVDYEYSMRADYSATFPCGIFGFIDSESGITVKGSSTGRGRCHYFILEGNGAEIMHLIPVRVGDVGYMYDRVSGQLFGNSGTGAFIIGPDKTI